MRCKRCDGVMEQTDTVGSLVTMKCVKCGWTINRQPEDLMSKSMKRARRQMLNAANAEKSSWVKESLRLEQAREELKRKKEARAAEVRRRQKAVQEKKVSTLDEVMADSAWSNSE